MNRNLFPCLVLMLLLAVMAGLTGEPILLGIAILIWSVACCWSLGDDHER